MPSGIERVGRTAASGIRKMSPSDLPLVVGIVCRTVKVLLIQNRVSIPNLVKAFETQPDQTMASARTDGMERLARVRWLTDGVLHAFFGGAYCTKRTMILFHYACKYGVDATVNFGVARQAQTIKGHAWLTVDGEPYMENDGTVDDYKVIYTYPEREND